MDERNSGFIVLSLACASGVVFVIVQPVSRRVVLRASAAAWIVHSFDTMRTYKLPESLLILWYFATVQQTIREDKF